MSYLIINLGVIVLLFHLVHFFPQCYILLIIKSLLIIGMNDKQNRMVSALLQFVLTISVIWLILLFISSKKDLEVKGFLVAPGILIWRTSRLNTFFERLSKKRGIGKFSEISVVAVISLFIAFPVVLFINIIRYFTDYAAPLLVANPISLFNVETVILIVIPLIIALFLHEMMHAVTAINEGVELKQTGLAIIVIFLASFVQMVPESLKKITTKGKLRIISSAIFANLLLALLVIPLLYSSSAIVSPLYHPSDGALITNVEIDGPADEAGIIRGQVIIAIRMISFDRPTEVLNVTSANSLIARLRDIEVGETFLLLLLDEELLISGVQPPKDSQLISGSYLGVSVFDYRPPRISILSPFLPYWFKIELQWIININLILGLFNLLPLPLTDGGKIYDLLMEETKIKNERKEKLRLGVYIVVGLLVGINLLLTIF